MTHTGRVLHKQQHQNQTMMKTTGVLYKQHLQHQKEKQTRALQRK